MRERCEELKRDRTEAMEQVCICEPQHLSVDESNNQ